MHKDLCGGKPGLCDAMKPTNGTELLRYLQKVSFEGKNANETGSVINRRNDKTSSSMDY